ncbi:MAG: flagellar basal body L-ring protein FlgH [Gemmatimonadetes bacterium]|nr:flagellar basal body L-ring protein FlgH [Gemmatimonadota bacterium]
MTMQRTTPLLAMLAALAALPGCASLDRLAEIGSPPRMTPIADVRRPSEIAAIRYPVPEAPEHAATANSIWRQGSKSFFKDQRASRIGDIVTVAINLADSADFTAESSRTRTDASSLNVGSLFGFRNQLFKRLPSDGPSGLLNSNEVFGLSGSGNFAGTGGAKRSESVKINLAAVIVEVLPNGNLVIAGKQELRVNQEMRDIQLTGIIRSQDIEPNNTVSSDKIAEGRISYGGRGLITDYQAPSYGQQMIEILRPF